MSNGEPNTAEQLTSLRASTRTTSHDVKNAVGLMWLHLASLERRLAPAGEGGGEGDAEVREAIAGLKEETRQIVKLLDALSLQARV